MCIRDRLLSHHPELRENEFSLLATIPVPQTLAYSKAERILTTARNNAKADQEKTLEETRSQIAGLAVLAAEKLLSGGSSQKGNQMLYDQFLAQAGEANDADGS